VCQEDEGTDCEDGDGDWFVKLDRIWHALCIKCMQVIVKYFFIAVVLLLVGHLTYG
jgi:hypothetical protein